MNGMYLSKAQRDFLDNDRATAQRNQRIMDLNTTAGAAANVAAFSTLYPTSSSELGLSLVASGIPASDPIVAQAVGIEQTQRPVNGPIDTPGGGIWDTLGRGLSEFVYDPIKGSARWAMMGLMSVYEAVPGGSPIRAGVQASQTGRGLFGEDSTLYEQQPFVTKGLADVFRDPGATLASVWQEATTRDTEQEELMRSGDMQFTSNFGSGWFANSTVDPEVQKAVDEQTALLHRQLDGQNLTPNQRYRKELESASDIWSKAVAQSSYQAALGAPTTQVGYANREAVGITMPSLAGEEGKVWTPWSPGRVAAATVLEPGTTEFSIASGVGDVSSQIFLDPMNLIGGLWAKGGTKGRTVYAAAKEIAERVARGKQFALEGVTMAPKNYVRSGITLEDVGTTGISGTSTGLGKPGVLAFHGGASEVAEGGLETGGLTQSLKRARGYADTHRKSPEDPGAIHAFRTEDLPPAARTKLESSEDVEQLMTRPTFPEDHPRRAEFEKIDKELSEIRDEMDTVGLGKEHDELEEVFRQKYQDLLYNKNFDEAARQEYLRYEESMHPDTAAGTWMSDALVTESPRPIGTYTIEEAERLLEEGFIPFTPDPTLDMMDNLKLHIDGGIYDPKAWESAELAATRPAHPLDPPEWYVNEYRKRRAKGTKNPRIVKGKSHSKFADEWDEFYLTPDAEDSFATADRTNRSVSQMPGTRRVTRDRAAGTNQKVRVYGSTVDLSAETLPKGMPAKVRDALVASGVWDHKYGFVGNQFGARPVPDDVLRVLRENNIGKVKMPDGQWMIVDDFIGGAGDDVLASRVFYSDGSKPIFSFETARGAKVTPDEVNLSIDQIKALGKHALTEDGMVDLSKLTPEEIAKFADENAEFISKLDEMVANGDIPPPTVPGTRPGIDPTREFDLLDFKGGKQADALVNDLWDMAQGSDGPKNIDRFFRKLEKKGIPITREVREAILVAAKEGTAEDIRSIMAGYIARGPGKIVLPGGTGYGRMRGVMGAIDSFAQTSLAGASMRGAGPVGRVLENTWMHRQMAQMLPSEGINLIDDPDRAYSQLVEWLQAYSVPRGSDEIEGVLSRLRNMEPGDKSEGYKIIRDYEKVLFEHLSTTTKGRVPEAFIKAATTFIEDVGVAHVYNAERIGKDALGGNAGNMVRIDGSAKWMPDMALTSEAWNGAMHIPNPTMIKRVSAYQSRLGQIANAITSKKMFLTEDLKWSKFSSAAWERSRRHQSRLDSARSLKQRIKALEKDAGRVEIQDRVGFLVARSAMNKLWKPLVLLRGAWTIRILMDDQLRVAASGQSMFNHPLRTISYALQQPKSIREAFRKGYIDVYGTRVTIDNIDDVHHGLMYQKAMMAVPDGVVGVGAHGSRYARVIRKGQPGYEEGVTSRLSQFGADPLGRKLAASDGSVEAIDDATEWLLGATDEIVMGSTGTKQMNDIIALKGDHSEFRAALERRDPEVVRRFVTQVNAEMHRTAGGVVVLNNGNGRWLDYADETTDVTDQVAKMWGVGPPKPDPLIASEYAPRVLQRGDSDILAVLADGKGPLKSSLATRDNTLSRKGHKEFRRLIDRKVKDQIEAEATGGPEVWPRFSSVSHGPDLSQMGGEKKLQEVMDGAVGFFYEWMMTKPSDRLSRSPLFAARYWRSIGERLPFLDDDFAAKVLARAEKAGKRAQVEGAAKETRKWLGKDAARAKGTLAVEVGSSEARLWDTLDEHAKAAGLAEVEDTLFNLTQKRNISDSLNLIFPFVEAWGEFMTRWSRLMVYGDRNIKNMNRLQQTVNGLRESDPFDPSSDRGFFYENEFGEEVFGFPAFMSKAQIGLHNALAAVTPMSPISPEVADSIKATGSVESLNFASGFIPGFGPVFQIAAKSALSDDPRWDSLKRIIAPFGTAGGAVAQFAPAWLKRLMSAMGSEDPQLKATWLSTVQDVIRTKMKEGAFDGVTDKASINAIVSEAEEEARNLLFVRTANTWWAPSSPSYTFTEEDTTGKIYTYTQLGQEYRKILYDEANGDETVAFELFRDRYGSLPVGFTQSKTYMVKPGPVTTEGWEFQRINEGFFDAYPNTAMYLMPEVNQETHEFNYERYLEQLRLSEREQWTGEQLVALNDDMLGNMEWDHAMTKIQPLLDAGRFSDHELEKMRFADEIKTRHPYWREVTPGKRAGATAVQKQAEVEAWLTDPSLQKSPIVGAARQYVEQRAEVLAELEARIGVTTINGSKKPEAIKARAWLRDFAEKLSQQVPEFDVLWSSVYSREVSMEHDGYSAQRVDFYEEDFFETTLGIPANTAPVFDNAELANRYNVGVG